MKRFYRLNLIIVAVLAIPTAEAAQVRVECRSDSQESGIQGTLDIDENHPYADGSHSAILRVRSHLTGQNKQNLYRGPFHVSGNFALGHFLKTQPQTWIPMSFVSGNWPANALPDGRLTMTGLYFDSSPRSGIALQQEGQLKRWIDVETMQCNPILAKLK